MLDWLDTIFKKEGKYIVIVSRSTFLAIISEQKRQAYWDTLFVYTT